MPQQHAVPAMEKLNRCGLVVVAAGRGTRFGGWKQLAPLGGKPLLVHTLEAFARCPFRDRVVVLPQDLLNEDVWDEILRKFPSLNDFRVVAGGAERSLSVLAGVRELSESCDFVAVHDGARPFPPIEAAAECAALLQARPDIAAAIVAKPVSDTIKMIGHGDNLIQRTVDRRLLLRAETPQVARRDLLLQALSSPASAAASDEAQALEIAGYPTACVVHHGYNPKITLAHDLALAEHHLTAGK
jgi:2-C-methyl-D-erythritol 4-phosphate cytidylyltransferase